MWKTYKVLFFDSWCKSFKLKISLTKLFCLIRSNFNDLHNNKQVRVHSMAGHSIQRRCTATVHNRLRSPKGRVQDHHPTDLLGRSLLGPNLLLPRLHGQVLLRHRWLRLRKNRVLREWWGAASDLGRVHAQRRGWVRLLRYQLGRRVQPPYDGRASGWDRTELHNRWLRDRPQRLLPLGAPGHEHRRRRKGGLQERVRGLWTATVLL